MEYYYNRIENVYKYKTLKVDAKSVESEVSKSEAPSSVTASVESKVLASKLGISKSAEPKSVEESSKSGILPCDTACFSFLLR